MLKKCTTLNVVWDLFSDMVGTASANHTILPPHGCPICPCCFYKGGTRVESRYTNIPNCIYNQMINKCLTSIQCNNMFNHWIHLKCSGILHKNYNPSFLCTLHTDNDSGSNSNCSSSSVTDSPNFPDHSIISSHSSDSSRSSDSTHPSTDNTSTSFIY